MTPHDIIALIAVAAGITFVFPFVTLLFIYAVKAVLNEFKADKEEREERKQNHETERK